MKKLYNYFDNIEEILNCLNNFDDIDKNIEFLEDIGCNESQIKNIISINPLFLQKDTDDLIKLKNKLISLGDTNLNITFDSNPLLLTIGIGEI